MTQIFSKLNILEHLNNLIYTELKKIYSELDNNKKLVTFSNRLDLGQFQSNIAFLLAKSYGKKPFEIADEIINYLSKLPDLTNLSQVNGFINFSLTKEYLFSFLSMLESRECYKIPKNDEKVLLDFGGPNIAKSMHVGHLRSSIIGDSLQKIYRFFGHEVISDIHIGDWGLPLGMVIMKLENDYPDLRKDEITPTSLEVIKIDLLEKIYPMAASECKENPEARQRAQKITMKLQQGDVKYITVWKKIVEVSISSLRGNYDNLGIYFDLWYGESSVNNIIPEILEKLLDSNNARESEGAVISDTSYDSPLILVNSEGGVTYGLTDIATIYDRVCNMKMDKLIYVVDKRQSLHFNQVFEVSKKAFNLQDKKLEHIGFGTLNGKDGKPFKTRAGGVMKLEDLIELSKNKVLEKMQNNNENAEQIASLIGVAALKFADLSKYRLTDYIFDVDQFTDFNGKTGPYLIYSCVRIKAILNKAKELNYAFHPINHLPESPLIDDVINNLLKFFSSLERAYLENSPHYLCDYLYNLAQSFSSFYNDINIIYHENEMEKGALLSFCKIILNNMELTLDLLGIESRKVNHM